MIEITVTFDRGGIFSNGMTNIQIKTDNRAEIDEKMEYFVRSLIPLV